MTKLKKSILVKKMDIKIIFFAFDFLIGFILTRGMLFNTVLPFGVAYSYTSYKHHKSIFGTLGAFLGYFTLANSNEGFRYAGTILIILAITYFLKINIYVITTGVTLISGILSIITHNYNNFNIITIFFTTIICTASTYLYSEIYNKESKYRLVAFLIFGVTILFAVSKYSIFFGITPVRIISVYLILVVNYYANIGIGTILAVVLGISIDSTLSLNIFTLGYSFASVISCTFSKMNKPLYASVFLIMFSVAGILGGDINIFLSGLTEVFIGSLIFVLTPLAYLKKAEEYLKYSPSNIVASNNKIYLEVCNILNKLSQTIFDGIEEVLEVDYKCVQKIFTKTSEKVCKNCVLSNKCWGENYINTTDALNFATSNIVEKKVALSTDFPYHFSTACVNFPSFINCVNESLQDIKSNIKSLKNHEDNKRIISTQYKAVSSILKDITGFEGRAVETFPNLQKSILKIITRYIVNANVSVYNNASGQMFVEISSENTFGVMNNMKIIRYNISKTLNRSMSFICEEIRDNKSVIIFREKDKFKIALAIKNTSKESFCGDLTSSFYVDHGKHHLLLCDGMGSGKKAFEESRSVLDLLERLLKAGVTEIKAVQALNPLINIKSNENNFVALDLFSIDLNSLEVMISKFGTPPTYILRKNKIHKVLSDNLPIGISKTSALSRLKLKENDTVLIMSDGICDGLTDDFITNILENSQNMSEKEIAHKILNNKNTSSDDDKTIIVFRVLMNK